MHTWQLEKRPPYYRNWPWNNHKSTALQTQWSELKFLHCYSMTLYLMNLTTGNKTFEDYSNCRTDTCIKHCSCWKRIHVKHCFVSKLSTNRCNSICITKRKATATSLKKHPKIRWAFVLGLQGILCIVLEHNCNLTLSTKYCTSLIHYY